MSVTKESAIFWVAMIFAIFLEKRKLEKNPLITRNFVGKMGEWQVLDERERVKVVNCQVYKRYMYIISPSGVALVATRLQVGVHYRTSITTHKIKIRGKS